MPEEINRALTHILGDLFFITEECEIGNLRREGILKERIYFVWNPIADTLFIKASKESSGINNSANLCVNPAPVDSPQRGTTGELFCASKNHRMHLGIWLRVAISEAWPDGQV
jgi:hypothetical protein